MVNYLFLGLRCWYYDNIAQVWLRLGTSAQVSNVAHGYIIIFKNSFSMFRTSKIKIILFFFKPLQGLSPVVFYNKSNVAFGARFFMLNFGFNFIYTRLPYLYNTVCFLKKFKYVRTYWLQIWYKKWNNDVIIYLNYVILSRLPVYV